MFVGEMGCWVVLGLSILYRRFIAPRLSRDQSPLLAGGYRPIRGEDGGLDDDEHTYDYVVEMLSSLFCMPSEVAFRHAVEVDTTGRTVVITCEREQAEFGRDQIHAYGADPRMPVSKGSMSAVVEPAGHR